MGNQEPEAAVSLQTPPDVPIIPEARRCTFEQFVNRFAPEDARYAIEYLEAGIELGFEMASEAMKRHLAKVKGYEDQNTVEYKSRRFDGGLSSGAWLQAVRIQSPAVLKALAEVSGYHWGTEAHTFMRPYGHLIHFHSQIRERLKSLMEAASKRGEEDEDEDAGSQEAVEHLQCYVSFVEKHLLPLTEQLDDADYSNPKRIRYEDLWYLFKPGELVYMPRRTLEKQLNSRGQKDAFEENTVSQTVWRLEVFQPHMSDLELPMIGGPSNDNEAKAKLYFVDFDGSSYKPVPINVQIDYFDGEKDIRSLAVFPIRFAARDVAAMMAECQEWGRKYTECIEQRHVSYKAWTLLNDPLGWRDGKLVKGRPANSPEFIDGEVIIDFQEAFNAHPSWKYAYGLRSDTWSSDVLTVRDKFPILLWSDKSRSKLVYEWPHIVVSDDDIDFLEGREFGKKHPYGPNGLDTPPPEDLVLLPRRLCGYGLRERRFLYLDVKYVKVGREHVDAFRFLQIDPNNRRIIHCLLTDHFNTKQARKMREIASQDPIPGKGHNLVFLLHGPPGVGKTATVEAVAQKYRKPLFSITSGDLGSTPDAVESSLTEIFHLANVWDCILLLDEADVFLEEREKSDLKRNAVVSVFLRVMEYYNGILFLTTNRPGQLDEAIKSRVHSALLYQTLTLQQTLEIFRMNIERLELIEKQRRSIPDHPQAYLQADKTGILAFAEKHWRQHEFDELGRWNGRQIRNAFISAAALARGDLDLDGGDDDGSAAAAAGVVAVLTERHFQDVANSVTAFDKYMARARGGLDSERARNRFDRPDYFSADESESTPVTAAARNRRASRNSDSGMGARERSTVAGGAAVRNVGHGGAPPHTPTPSPRLFNYHHAPVSPSPPYYVQPAAQGLAVAGGHMQQALGGGGGYVYPVQGYGGTAGGSMPAWSAPPGVQSGGGGGGGGGGDGGVPGSLPVIQLPQHGQQQFSGMVQQSGNNGNEGHLPGGAMQGAHLENS
ncbi:hypothetical protein N658DRAFT_510156 [Parathielavia hyrcaniae]|uniref:AAA+ ATPase domain-containing protein n=1 Tax=Parathielavia hyrcaniae TaxID=113614 RepID=A0AAN6PX67_9PEZI|nr:hypothetical protein N658DRAFT_510156 [Parathielavia hyrcaniae]